MGSGIDRDYNNFNTGAVGLGSDTSVTTEFADEETTLLIRSRPNQANGSTMFINEVEQISDFVSISSAPYHSETVSVFGVTSNTANVSSASGGTRSY